MSVMLALGRLKLGDGGFGASPKYTAKFFLEQTTKFCLDDLFRLLPPPPASCTFMPELLSL